MLRNSTFILFCFLSFLSVKGQDNDLSRVIYSSVDSILVEQLLHDDNVGDNPVLYYARYFVGKPYVVHTLEKSDPERLVVNLRELDCTTLIETVGALSMAKSANDTTFQGYCKALEKMRYFDGKMNGYCSRLHYFTWWICDNLSKSIVEEVSDGIYTVTPLIVNNYYMSLFPQKYKYLKGNSERVAAIKKLEKRYNGHDGNYIAAHHLKKGKKDLGFIKDGDIIAIVTKKKGLDYSHLGFAVWGEDGKLHLLNASSIHKKVVEEPMTLYEYLKKHPTSVGIRVFRYK